MKSFKLSPGEARKRVTGTLVVDGRKLPFTRQLEPKYGDELIPGTSLVQICVRIELARKYTSKRSSRRAVCLPPAAASITKVSLANLLIQRLLRLMPHCDPSDQEEADSRRKHGRDNPCGQAAAGPGNQTARR